VRCDSDSCVSIWHTQHGPPRIYKGGGPKRWTHDFPNGELEDLGAEVPSWGAGRKLRCAGSGVRGWSKNVSLYTVTFNVFAVETLRFYRARQSKDGTFRAGGIWRCNGGLNPLTPLWVASDINRRCSIMSGAPADSTECIILLDRLTGVACHKARSRSRLYQERIQGWQEWLGVTLATSHHCKPSQKSHSFTV